jgi:hypothetical protein
MVLLKNGAPDGTLQKDLDRLIDGGQFQMQAPCCGAQVGFGTGSGALGVTVDDGLVQRGVFLGGVG